MVDAAAAAASHAARHADDGCRRFRLIITLRFRHDASFLLLMPHALRYAAERRVTPAKAKMAPAMLVYMLPWRYVEQRCCLSAAGGLRLLGVDIATLPSARR